MIKVNKLNVDVYHSNMSVERTTTTTTSATTTIITITTITTTMRWL